MKMRSTDSRADQVSAWAPVFGGWRRVEYLLGAGVWVAAIIYFWHWWLQPANHTYLVGSILVTAILAWVTLLPAYFIFLFFRARRPVGPLNLPAGSRIAMVVTKAPSEPFGVVAETLRAMLAQNVPHDTWLADEDPSPETLAWCREHGVFVSTRRGRADYHLHTWPRRTRCKEGNLAFFYDHYGYERYDFVAQLDADHVPTEGYLFEMLRPFADPAIGYVSAPSICDRKRMKAGRRAGASTQKPVCMAHCKPVTITASRPSVSGPTMLSVQLRCGKLVVLGPNLRRIIPPH